MSITIDFSNEAHAACVFLGISTLLVMGGVSALAMDNDDDGPFGMLAFFVFIGCCVSAISGIYNIGALIIQSL